MTGKKRSWQTYLITVAIWLLMIVAFVTVSALQGINQAHDEVKQTGTSLHRVLSQRAAQHDAHLTSLNALILSANPPPIDALRQVSRNIIRFYPRISLIDVMLLESEEQQVSMQPFLMVDETEHGNVADEFAAQIAAQKPGVVRSYLSKKIRDRYYLGKKSDNSNPGYAILMAIHPALMIEAEERPDWADLSLTLNGQIVLQEYSALPTSSTLFQPAVFSQKIDSQSQPLVLRVSRPIVLAEIINPLHTAFFAIFSLIGLLVFYSLWQSLRATKKAEQKAQLLEHETRLAHAARVNSMGELASGIAHELTQPLTALLSQSQAALRLEASGERPELLRKALTANVREASRAGEILKRMRSYMSNHEPQRKQMDIGQIIRDVSELLRTDMALRNIELLIQTEKNTPAIMGDPVEMEQVIYNLIRNAADSLDQAEISDKRILLTTRSGQGQIVITVTDNGNGIAKNVLPRLFEPFFTTRKDGMGLGLSLCATLIERIDGEIVAANRPDGGAEFTITLPAAGVSA